jgi:carbon monoxide dehydrogenase subunit G
MMAAPLDELWKIIEDPHHMARWWPDVVRVEGVQDDRFTQVYLSKRGRTVRMDQFVRACEPPGTNGAALGRLMWEQDLAGSPFERMIAEWITEILLEPDGTSTRVTVEQRQKLRGYNRTGGFMMKKATRKRLDDALDGLERITGPAGS